MTAAAESKPPGTEPYLRRHGEDAVWFMGALFNPFASGEDTEGRFALIETVGRFARVCKSRISKPVSLLCLALGCTVLRSQWCQSGVRSSWITRRWFRCARLRCAMGTGISMPCSAATSTSLPTSGWSSKTGGPASPSIGLPTSSKKRSYKPSERRLTWER